MYNWQSKKHPQTQANICGMKGLYEGITDNFEMTVVRADLPYQNKENNCFSERKLWTSN